MSRRPSSLRPSLAFFLTTLATFSASSAGANPDGPVRDFGPDISSGEEAVTFEMTYGEADAIAGSSCWIEDGYTYCASRTPASAEPAPTYDSNGKKCQWTPSDQYLSCTLYVTGQCPVSADPQSYDYVCHDIHPYRNICNKCGEDEPGFVQGTNPNEYAPSSADIQSDIDAGRWYASIGYRGVARNAAQNALNMTVVKWGFDRSPDKYVVLVGFPDDVMAEIRPNGKDRNTIFFGGRAFRNEGFLAATIAHETIHQRHRRYYGEDYFWSPEGTAYTEWQAYRWINKNAARFDIDEATIADLGWRTLEQQYLDEFNHLRNEKLIRGEKLKDVGDFSCQDTPWIARVHIGNDPKADNAPVPIGTTCPSWRSTGGGSAGAGWGSTTTYPLPVGGLDNWSPP